MGKLVCTLCICSCEVEEVIAFALMLLCKHVPVIKLMNSVVRDYTAVPFNRTWETHPSHATNQIRTSKKASKLLLSSNPLLLLMRSADSVSASYRKKYAVVWQIRSNQTRFPMFPHTPAVTSPSSVPLHCSSASCSCETRGWQAPFTAALQDVCRAESFCSVVAFLHPDPPGWIPSWWKATFPCGFQRSCAREGSALCVLHKVKFICSESLAHLNCFARKQTSQYGKISTEGKADQRPRYFHARVYFSPFSSPSSSCIYSTINIRDEIPEQLHMAVMIMRNEHVFGSGQKQPC